LSGGGRPRKPSSFGELLSGKAGVLARTSCTLSVLHGPIRNANICRSKRRALLWPAGAPDLAASKTKPALRALAEGQKEKAQTRMSACDDQFMRWRRVPTTCLPPAAPATTTHTPHRRAIPRTAAAPRPDLMAAHPELPIKDVPDPADSLLARRLSSPDLRRAGRTGAVGGAPGNFRAGPCEANLENRNPPTRRSRGLNIPT